MASFQDTFDYANFSDLHTRNPLWVYAITTVPGKQIGTQNTYVNITDSGETVIAAYTGDTFSTAQYSQVSALTLDPFQDGGGAAVRCISGVGAYVGIVRANAWAIGYWQGTTYTDLVRTAGTYAAPGNVRLEIDSLGNLELFYSGVSLGTYDDTSNNRFTSALSYPGFGGITEAFDNFDGGDLSTSTSIEVYDSPTTSAYYSTVFSATVEPVTGGTQYNANVYQFSQSAEGTVTGLWVASSYPIISVCNIGSEVDVKITIANLIDPISSCKVMPTHLNFPYEISGSNLLVSASVGDKLYIQTNGSLSTPLIFCVNQLESATPAGATQWVSGISSVSSGQCVYFPKGMNIIPSAFVLQSNASALIKGGAFLSGGNFHISANNDNWLIYGPGYMDAYFEDFNVLRAAGYYTFIKYAPVYGNNNLTCSNGVIRDVTIAKSILYNFAGGATTDFDNVKIINPWHFNTDGFKFTKKSNNAACTINNCISFCADDNLHIDVSAGDVSGSNNILVNSHSASIMLGYWSNLALSSNYRTELYNTYVIPLQVFYDPSANTYEFSGVDYGEMIKCWLDVSNIYTNFGRSNVLLSGLYIDDARGTGIRAMPFSFLNRIYPFGAPAPTFDPPYGQMSGIDIYDCYIENTPVTTSRILGYDATQTPHDITFHNLYINNTKIHKYNYSPYFNINSYAYNINFDDGQGRYIVFRL